MEVTEYKRRFKDRIIEVLTRGDNGWDLEEATVATDNEWDSVSAYEHMDGFPEDPEDAADEEISYWDQD